MFRIPASEIQRLAIIDLNDVIKNIQDELN